MVMATAALAYFAALALYRIDLPGLYYDEAIFVPVSLRTLGECDLDAAVGHALGCFPVRQSPFYVGALKAWLHAPIFAVFGVSPATIRIPMLLLAASALVLTFRFLRPRLGPWAATAALLLMATDPVFVFHSRVDWGPFVLATWFKLLALGYTLKWLESGRGSHLGWALVALVLGFFDKLNFLWFVVALGGAVITVYPLRVWGWLLAHPKTGRRLGIPFVALVLAGTGWAFYMVKVALPAAGHHVGGPEPLEVGAQVAKVAALYASTFDASAQYGWMFARSLAVTSWTPHLLLPQLLFGTAVSFALLFRRCAPFGPARLLAFANTLLLFLLVVLVATKEVAGSHHLVMLWPFHHLHLILCGALISAWLEGTGQSGSMPRLGTVLAGVLVMVLVAQQVRVGRAYAAALDPEGSYNPRFDPAIYELAETVGAKTTDLVVSVDWGIHQALVSLAPKHRRARYKDWWPVFMQPPGIDARRDQGLLKETLTGRTLLFVTHARSKANFGEAVANFPDYLAYWGLGADPERVIRGTDGEPLFVVVRVCRSAPDPG